MWGALCSLCSISYIRLDFNFDVGVPAALLGGGGRVLTGFASLRCYAPAPYGRSPNARSRAPPPPIVI